MICDSYEFDGLLIQHIYFNLFTVLAIISPILFLYVSFCIIFLSPKMMQTYRWFLLAHQLSAELVSFYIHTYTRLITFAPIPISGITGFSKYFMSARYLLPGGILLESINTITIIQLFAYRYWAVAKLSTSAKLFNNIHAFLVVLGYCFAILLFLLPLYIDCKSPNATREIIMNYTCIRELTAFPIELHGYDGEILLLYFGIPLLFSIGVIFSVYGYLVFANLNAINISSQSPQLRRLHRNYIIQLVYQMVVPMLILFFPAIYVFLSVYTSIERNTFMINAATLSVAAFSIIDSTILIVMNKNYRAWIITKFRKYAKYRTSPMLSFHRMPNQGGLK